MPFDYGRLLSGGTKWEGDGRAVPSSNLTYSGNSLSQIYESYGVEEGSGSFYNSGTGGGRGDCPEHVEMVEYVADFHWSGCGVGEGVGGGAERCAGRG